MASNRGKVFSASALPVLKEKYTFDLVRVHTQLPCKLDIEIEASGGIMLDIQGDEEASAVEHLTVRDVNVQRVWAGIE